MEGNKLLEYLEIVKFALVENNLSKHLEVRDSRQFGSHFFSSSENTKTNLNNIVKKIHCPLKGHLHS